MLFSDAEREYRNLKAQFDAGQLSEADFRARLEDLMIEDDAGRWWSIGYETGKWYYNDGEKWVRGDPPALKAATAPAAAESSGSTPANVAGAALGGVASHTAVTSPLPAVAPGPGSGAVSADVSGAKAAAAEPGRRKSMLLAAIGALVVVVLAVGAYLVLSRQFMVMSKQDMATPPASAASVQAGAMAMASTVSPEISPTAAAMAAMPAATSAPADTPSPTSVPPTDTATPQAGLPTSTVAAVQATAAPTASPLPDTPTPEPPTPTPAPTATKAPAATATKIPAAKPVATAAPAARAVPGLITGFEQWGAWKRGDQPYGTFQQSTQEAHSGSASGRLDYNFPAVNDNYVVFASRPPLAIPGTPTALSIRVLGDGSGNFLNVWVQDSQGEVRQFPFGTIPGAGSWQQLTASLDTTAAWPQTHISGPDNGKLDYPIKLYALVLDGVPDGVASQGTIYLDDIMAASGN